MLPMYFGQSEQPLFGIYHPPTRKLANSSALLLCPPVGVEGLRSHRAFRQLATNLSKAGHHVLRFDYYGTGDSGGDTTAGSSKQWLADIKTAVEELKDNANVSSVSLVGLRFGATLAWQYAEQFDDVDEVVLWDPVLDGDAYVAEMLAADAVYEPGKNHVVNMNRKVANGETVGIMGYELTADLRDDLTAINFTDRLYEGKGKAFILVSSMTDSYSNLEQVSKRSGGKMAFQHIESPGNWCEIDAFGSLLLPQAIIQGIVACVS